MNARRLLIVTTLIALIGAWLPSGTVATTQGQVQPLDLAAMALAPEDVPAGYFDDYGEWLVPAAVMQQLVLGGDTPPSGLEWMYQTFYFSPEQATGIHVFLFEFASADQADAGAAVVDGVLRPPLPEGTTLGPTHAPGPALGEDPRTITTVTYDTWAAGGPRVAIVAVSFRHDRLIAGISIEQYTDPPDTTTPAAEAVASPVAPARAQEQLAQDLAGTLDSRVTDVLAGTAPVGTDLSLPSKVLPIDQLADHTIPLWGGYKSGIDFLRCGICGEENSLVAFAEATDIGYARGGVLGPLVDGEPQPPFVSVAVLILTSPEDALALLEAIRQAPNDLPTPIPVPRGMRTITVDPAIADADAALAYQAAMDEEDPNAPIDSAGVVFAMGELLVVVDVLGGLSADEAMETATDLATQQAACLVLTDPCTSATQPVPLAEATTGR